MQGAFNLKIEGNLDKVKKWLEEDGMFKYFYVCYPTETCLEMGEDCNLSALNESFMERLSKANPEVSIVFDMIYDNSYVLRYTKEKDTTEYKESDESLRICNWCNKILPVDEMECVGENEYDEFAEFYCEECYKDYLEEEGLSEDEYKD